MRERPSQRSLNAIVLLFILSLVCAVVAQTPANASSLPVGSCTATIPCSNGACCNSVSGFCGFGSAFCTTVANGGPCTSNCDALAECGQGSAPENFTCPLNVCCSQFGFCGTTDEFCATGCQSNCNPPSQDSCGDNQQTALQRRIGYYEGWAVSSDSRACDVYPPESISAETLTHVNFAFALISGDFQLQEMSVNDNLLWMRTTALKQKNPALKVFLSIGGWSFNDPPTQNIFSDLVGSTENTNTFIASALSVLQAYSFDGIDIDWEYPVAPERGGAPADKENYPTFMAAVKAAFASRGYGLSFTAPSSYWYLQHFDLPALLKSADWVNVMTYDLHGVWDGTDPYIGPEVLAHTNLTEIKSTMQLFRNVGVDPLQIVLGIGFYGRSFQLADGSCSDPGCPFVGGGAPGICSLSSGTLMFSEIEEIISSNALVPTYDSVDAVKYIVWDEDQWVSYDDAQTFQLKMDYANSICLGGTMIWSVDQDDTSYTALQGLYPDIDVNNPSSSESGNMCQVTGCGQNCPAGYDSLTTLTSIPNSATSCDPSNPARLCCPPGDEPQNCVWRGGGGTSCNAQCNVGEIVMALDLVGDDGHPTCLQGYKAYCCQSGQVQPAACFGTSCDEDESCVSGYEVQTHVKQGSSDNGASCEQSPDPKQVCPEICQSNTKPVCCEDNYGLSNCQWVGDPPNCLNAACSAGQVAVFSDMQGDATTSCVGNNKRYYCCDPPANAGFLPVPEDWIFLTAPPAGGDNFDTNQPATFTVDFDDNTGPADTSSAGAGSNAIGDDGAENDSPFGEVFISSPNAASVSSVDIASDWVITGCSATSDQPQEVLAYCSKDLDDEDSGCSHVFIGQAEHTIVRMPSSCGLGPYARIASLTVHPDQDVLPAEHKARKRSTEKVYSLKFDYEFLAIPEDNGPVLMRADITDIPGYWDAIVDSAPDSTTTRKHKRNFHQPHEYDKRWFGPFDEWLAKLTTVTSSNSISRNFHWADTYTIFHQEEQCPNFQSSLDISVSGFASVSSSFGYYLEATIVPPDVLQAYVFFRAGAQAQASFTIQGLAEASFDSNRYELASFGFPGLYYPGLLTLGPSLHLYGEISGQLSLSGTFTASVGYTFPSLDLSFGKQDGSTGEENGPADVTPDENNNSYDFSVGYNVNLAGSLDAHLIPSLQLGVSVLGGALIDAQVFTEADIYAGVGITGSVSSTSAAQFCVNPRFGVNLNAGLTGNVLFWSTGPVAGTFYSAAFPFGGSCFSSVDQGPGPSGNGKRDNEDERYIYEAVGRARQGAPLDSLHSLDTPAYSALEHKSSKARQSSTQVPTETWSVNDLDIYPVTVGSGDNFGSANSTLYRRGGVPFLPGNLFCPAVGGDILDTPAGSQDCICYSDTDEDDTDQLADILNKRDFDDAEDYVASNLTGATRTTSVKVDPHMFDSSKLKTCTSSMVPIPEYSDTSIVTYFDLDNPGVLDPTYGTYNPVPIRLGNLDGGVPALSTPGGVGVYGREHVYEQSMSALFIDYLARFPQLWRNAAQNNQFCPWVASNLMSTTNGPSVFQQIGNCYPGGTSGTDRMVALEANANTYKNKAMYDGERQLNGLPPKNLASTTTFGNYCATKQISRLRAAAAVPSYMNDFTVMTDFMRDNNCIRAVWVAWYNAYLASNVDAPNRAQVNVPNLYDNWIHDIVAGMVPYLQQQITTLIPFYNGPGATGAKLSFAILLDNWQIENRQGQTFVTDGVAFTENVMATQADLTNQILNSMQNINWVNQLPTH
ncbi:hypothetical protein M0805_001223 [Coniferiporia weirii]|nr:hypothetical protein M0805_001223 [Coniferiporia weirii]